MIKPEKCKGCPFYQDGDGFVPDDIKPNAAVHLILQNPGETEVFGSPPKPMIGRTGIMTQAWFDKLGFTRDKLSLSNIIKCRWQKKNTLPQNRDGSFAQVVIDAAQFCTRAYLEPVLASYKPNETALLGELSLLQLTGRSPITSWRGSTWWETKLGRKVTASMHPASLFVDPRMRTAIRQDIMRICREARKPQPVHTYDDSFLLAVSPEYFVEMMRSREFQNRRITLDIETSWNKAIEAKLKIVGVGWSPTAAMNVDYEGATDVEQAEIRAAIGDYTGEIVTATPFDYAVLSRLGTRFPWGRCHDLTLLHSRFDIELPHTVEFIASMWTERAFWKWMSSTDPFRYNALDCAAEWEAFDKIWRHCSLKDRDVLRCYNDDRKLTKVCVAFQLNGLPWRERAYLAEQAYYEYAREELANEVSASFSQGSSVSDGEGVERCERHPRYSGKGPVTKRKGETDPCRTCQAVRECYLSRQPLNLRSRLQLARKLREAGMNVGTSLDKGKVAALAKKYNDPRLMRYLDFKRRDTIITRYFSEPKTTKRTGRIHSSYSMHAAKHRWSSNEPNAQQFMRPEE